jgi:YfiH family protein
MTNPDQLEPSFLLPHWPVPSQVRAMVSTRTGGKSQAPYASLNLGLHVGDASAHVLANRALVSKGFPADPLWLNQTHSTIVSTPTMRAVNLKTPIDADAIVSNVPNEVLAIMTADCLPVLFTSTTGSEVGAAHAGWRGLCAGILENTVGELLTLNPKLKPLDLIVWMGPAIGPKCFEVGEDVLESFLSSRIPFPDSAFIAILNKPGKYLADIYELARSRLQSVGISQIYGGDLCTVSDPAQFFSYRRDGQTGRFASFIWTEA